MRFERAYGIRQTTSSGFQCQPSDPAAASTKAQLKIVNRLRATSERPGCDAGLSLMKMNANFGKLIDDFFGQHFASHDQVDNAVFDVVLLL